jgi:hypothetical protein
MIEFESNCLQALGGDLSYNASCAKRRGSDWSASFQILGITAAVPEPSTWAMLILGFAGVGFMLIDEEIARYT